MLYYIHGYQSDPTSTKGTLFNKTLYAKAIKYRDGKPEDLVIADCLRCIAEEIKDDNEAVLIGSSLGGFLAAKTALNYPVKNLILLNPAIIPTTVDITKIQDMPQRILFDMKDDNLFETKITAEIIILRGTEDDVVPDEWVLAFAKAQEATIRLFNDDHSFTRHVDKLPEIIAKIID
ncbi:hypothetical protein KA005_06805 [bacterium]|nr:hypothetical protein [bacterium]